MDIEALLKAAKIGRERKDAQIETCAPFAAALYDVLVENGLEVALVAVGYAGATYRQTWYHQVLEHDGRYYDSMGEFSTEVLGKRLKIHPKVEFELSYKPDSRDGCYDEEDYGVLYDFLVKAFKKAAASLQAGPEVEAACSPRI
jgi:hypothetical protein